MVPPLSLLFSSLFVLLVVLDTVATAATNTVPAAQLASLYGLATSTSFPFPTATQPAAGADTLIVSEWSLGKGRIQDNPKDITFVDDPFPSHPVPNSPSVPGPVLQVQYPAGSYSHGTGGTQWYNLWNTTDGSAFLTMVASYEIAFEEGFQWVKGGKLPGLRGGLNSTGCSGGNESDGKDCFSTRLMWRPNGAGEVYAYIPPANDLCKQDGIICNSDFGISIDRGAFSFTSGQWNRVTLLVRMNDPPQVANGNVQLYYNDALAINQTGLQIRSSSTVTINGLYFSTFFGGSDSSWATPNTTYTYFRNMQLWGGSAPSNATGPQVTGAAQRPAAFSLTAQVAILLTTCTFGAMWV